MLVIQRIEELLPELRDTHASIQQLYDDYHNACSQVDQQEKDDEQRKIVQHEVVVKYAQLLRDQQLKLRSLTPKIRGLRHEEMPSELSEEQLSCVSEFFQLCLLLEEKGRTQRKAADASSGGQQTNLDKEFLPWSVPALGELLLEMPRFCRSQRTTELFLQLAADWVRKVAELYITSLHHKASEGELSLFDLVKQLAGYLCEDGKHVQPEVILALSKIAHEGNLEDPSVLTDKYAGILLPVLEKTKPTPENAVVYAHLINLAGRHLFSREANKQELSHFVAVLWEQTGVPCCGQFEEIGNVSLWEWSMGDKDEALSVIPQLTSAFWLARAYQQMGDEGREFFCAHAFLMNNRESMLRYLEVELGLGEHEIAEIEKRYSLLETRLITGQPWLMTPITRTEFTANQVQSIAQAAAHATLEELRNTGTGLSRLLAHDVESNLKKEFGKDKKERDYWRRISSVAQQALMAASFVRKAQPDDYDYGGAVVLEWKALEQCLDKCLGVCPRIRLGTSDNYLSELC